MKKLLFIKLISIASFVYSQKTSFQRKISKLPQAELFVMAPAQFSGAGGGYGLFSDARTLIKWNFRTRIDYRFGFDYFVAGLGHRNIENVPLLAPAGEFGKISFSNSMNALNFCTRLSFPRYRAIVPYTDFFIGWRDFSSHMSIFPYRQLKNYEYRTTQFVVGGTQLAAGLNFGLMIRVTDYLRLNAGIMYSFSPFKSNLVNLKTVRLESGTLIAEKIQVPHGFVSGKFGCTFLIEEVTGTNNNRYNHFPDLFRHVSIVGSSLLKNAVHLVLK